LVYLHRRKGIGAHAQDDTVDENDNDIDNDGEDFEFPIPILKELWNVCKRLFMWAGEQETEVAKKQRILEKCVLLQQQLGQC
jgi:hypothetical protein